MTKRLVDIDDQRLAAVQAVLGTKTIKGTVEAAFKEVLDLVARRKSLLAETASETSPLTDPEARRSAWG